MAGLPIFSIPGNIKQRFLPFVLNPSANINDSTSDSSAFQVLKPIGPQLFTYKNYDEEPIGGLGSLGFYPATSFQQSTDQFSQLTHKFKNNSNLEKDLSFQMVYGNNPKPDTTPLTINDIISTLPGVSIREFLPDTRLNQCLNFFTELFGEMGKTMIAAKNFGKNEKANEETKYSDIFNKILKCATFAIKYMTGLDNNDKNFANDFIKFAGAHANISDTGQLYKPAMKNYIRYVQEFPYILYYKLQSCTTTNIYEVPAMSDGKIIMTSDGMAGWGDGSDFMGAGGFRVSGFLDKIPLIGTIANMILGNIGINYMPWWNAESGSKVAEPEMTVKFELFNDNIYKALINFIFVNTLVPSNKWMQYNIFQHSSNLYDVKIEGINRLFACAGAFTVTSDGVLRNPPEKFFDYLKGHLSPHIGFRTKFIDHIKANNLIKIPDVYHVEMRFKSLLPANFNNFIYSYSYNVNHLTNYSDHVYDPTLGAAFGQTIRNFGTEIKKIWTGESQATSTSTKTDSSSFNPDDIYGDNPNPEYDRGG